MNERQSIVSAVKFMNFKDEFRPIFIVGNSRSGTTLMSRILGNHPLVFTFNELHFFEELWDPESASVFSPSQALKLATQLLDIQRHGYLNQTKSLEFLKEAEKIVEIISGQISPPFVFSVFLTYESHLKNKVIPCEQTPRNVLYLREILDLYPKARIINMIRDPRDILLSQKRRWKRPFLSKTIPKKAAFRYWMNYHPVTISKLWNTNIRAAKKFENDDRLFNIRFEDLLNDPQKKIKEVCDFIDIPFNDSLLEVPQIGSSSQTDNPDKLGINKDRQQSWRQGGLSSTEILVCQKINHEFMINYGYELETVKFNLPCLAVNLLLFPLKILLSFFLNLKRMKNIRTTIMRRMG